MISIIVPAHNEEKYIGQLFTSLQAQSFTDFEVIVICDACSDNTAKIAKRWNHRVYEVEERNVSAARNLGAARARGDILVFVDADCAVDSDFLSDLVRVMNKQSNQDKQNIVGGTVRTYSLERIWRARFVWSVAHILRRCFFWLLPTASGLLFCRASAFAKVRGYDIRRKLAEDTHLLLQLRKSGKLVYLFTSGVKTSARRMEKEGYLWTLYRQYLAFFIRNKKGY